MIADLKPYPAMKDSGVPWLGEVPGHWEVFPLKRVARPESSGSYGVEPEQGELVLPVATTAQIDHDGVFAVGRMPIRGFSKSEADRYGCCAGDVLIVKSSGSAANVISGKAGIVRKGDALFVFEQLPSSVAREREPHIARVSLSLGDNEPYARAREDDGVGDHIPQPED